LRRATIGDDGWYRAGDAVSVYRFVAEVIVGRLSDPRLLAKLTVARVAMPAKVIPQTPWWQPHAGLICCAALDVIDHVTSSLPA
jgi:hypothetical protein